MLACVSTLTDVVSYKDVRESKRFLTTNEAISYIEDNCYFLWLMMSCIDPGKEYLRLYSWARTYSKMRPNFFNVLVKDNGCRKVIFWDSEEINEQEAIWKNYFENGHWRAVGTRWGWAYEYYLKGKEEAPRGNYYDPEWF
jgi:hypothetical protein